MLNIVLHQPEIPQNTGNIGRTCVATGAVLHLIEPLGFSLNEKQLKRAGMDYWDKLDVRRYINFEDFLEKNPAILQGAAENGGIGMESSGAGAESGCRGKVRLWMATTKAKHVYSDVQIGPDDYIMFGKESAGIPEEILVEHEETCIRIPMLDQIRSLNLSNSVAIVLYEALRQNRFAGLQETGELHRLQWKE